MVDFNAEQAFFYGVFGTFDLDDTSKDTDNKGGWHNPTNNVLAAIDLDALSKQAVGVRALVKSAKTAEKAAAAGQKSVIARPTPPADWWDTLQGELGGRLAGYEGAVPGLAHELTVQLGALVVPDNAKQYRDALVEKISQMTGTLGGLANAIAGAANPSVPGAQRSPWTTCGKGWIEAVAGTGGIALAIVGATVNPTTIPLGLKLIFQSVRVLDQAWGDLVAGGCQVSFL